MKVVEIVIVMMMMMMTCNTDHPKAKQRMLPSETREATTNDGLSSIGRWDDEDSCHRLKNYVFKKDLVWGDLIHQPMTGLEPHNVDPT